MKTIMGYDISLWALMFHLNTQSKYVLEMDKDNKTESFINPLAFEISKQMDKILKREVSLSYNLSSDDIKSIVAYMNKNIDPVVKTRRIIPSILLLVSIEQLYYSKFEPCYEILGTGIVLDFIEDFVSRALNSEKTKKVYEENCFIIKNIIDPNTLPYAARKRILFLKNEFKDILNASYGSSVSHGWEHIDHVLSKSIYYRDKYNLKVDDDELILSVLFHDIYSHTDRDNHHELGAKWIEASIHPLISNDKEKQKRIANAIREHRAGYKGAYYSPTSEILATADRDIPILEDVVFRSYLYTKEKNPTLTHKETIAEVLKHVEEKYSRKGYIQYTNMFVLEHKDELTDMLLRIDKLLANKLVIKISNISGNTKINIKRK